MIGKNPFICGFFKVKVYQLMLNYGTVLGKNDCDNRKKGDVYLEQCQEIKDYFTEGRFDFDSSKYRKIGPEILDVFKSLARNAPDKKRIILQNFDRESWEKLALLKKREHSLFDCKGCLKNKNFKHGLSMFPIPNVFKAKAQRLGLIRKPLQDISNISPGVAQKQREKRIKRDLVKKIEKVKEITSYMVSSLRLNFFSLFISNSCSPFSIS